MPTSFEKSSFRLVRDSSSISKRFELGFDISGYVCVYIYIYNKMCYGSWEFFQQFLCKSANQEERINMLPALVVWPLTTRTLRYCRVLYANRFRSVYVIFKGFRSGYEGFCYVAFLFASQWRSCTSTHTALLSVHLCILRYTNSPIKDLLKPW